MGDGQGLGRSQVGLGVQLDPAHQRVGRRPLRAVRAQVQDRLPAPHPQAAVALLDAHVARAVRVAGHLLDAVVARAQAERLQLPERRRRSRFLPGKVLPGQVLPGPDREPAQGGKQAQVQKSRFGHGSPL